jgi:hypothetical protein
MNKMRMPGFCAEASLLKTAQRYVLSHCGAAAGGKVVPQGLWVNPVTHHLIYCDDVVGCIDLGYRGPIYLM